MNGEVEGSNTFKEVEFPETAVAGNVDGEGDPVKGCKVRGLP